MVDDGTMSTLRTNLITISFPLRIGVHVFGLCSTALITDIIQLSTGYQAPYFLTVCKPNYTSLNVSCKENSYIVEDICSGSDLTVINSGRSEIEILNLPLSVFSLFMNSMGYHFRHTFFGHNDFGFIFLFFIFNPVISLVVTPQKLFGGSFQILLSHKFQPHILATNLHITKSYSCFAIYLRPHYGFRLSQLVRFRKFINNHELQSICVLYCLSGRLNIYIYISIVCCIFKKSCESSFWQSFIRASSLYKPSRSVQLLTLHFRK